MLAEVHIKQMPEGHLWGVPASQGARRHDKDTEMLEKRTGQCDSQLHCICHSPAGSKSQGNRKMEPATLTDVCYMLNVRSSISEHPDDGPIGLSLSLFRLAD